MCSHLEQEDMANLDITPQTMRSTRGKYLSSWEMLSPKLHVEGKINILHYKHTIPYDKYSIPVPV